MTSRLGLAVVALAAAASLHAASASEQSAAQLFQQGLMLERAEGKTEQALFLYERVIAEFPADRTIVTQALYHLARAYEKRSDPRARTMWTRLASAETNPYSAEARKKIAVGQTESAGPFTPRTIDSNYLAGSPDGRWVVYYKGDQQTANVGRLYVRDLQMNSERLLLDLDGLVANPTWSPDSRSLAFYFRNTAEGARDIRIVSLTNGSVRSLGVSGFPIAWTARGDLLFYRSNLPSVDMFAMPVTGSQQPRKVYSENVNDTCGWAITPDGGSLVACRAKRLMLHDIASGAAQALTTGSGDQTRPLVSADGRLVAFASNDDGKWALYAAPLDRLPVSNPLRISTIDDAAMAATRASAPAWWTDDGLLAMRLTVEDRNVYRVDMEPSTGRAVDAPRRLTQDAPQNYSPSVNSDSSRIAYLYRNGVKRGIAVMDRDGLNERPLVEYPGLLPLYWASPDEILYHDFTGPSATNGNIVSLNIRTGATDSIARISGAYWWFVPSRREILHVYPSGAGYLPGAELKALSLPDRRERVVAKIDFLAPRLAVSADGRRIAYTVAPSRTGGTPATGCELALMSIEGTREKTFAMPGQPCREAMAWSPDGKFLLLGSTQGPAVMNVETGQSWAAHPDVSNASWEAGSWSPDGSFITLTKRLTRSEFLAWEGVTYDVVTKAAKRSQGVRQ